MLVAFQSMKLMHWSMSLKTWAQGRALCWGPLLHTQHLQYTHRRGQRAPSFTLMLLHTAVCHIKLPMSPNSVPLVLSLPTEPFIHIIPTGFVHSSQRKCGNSFLIYDADIL